MSSIRLGFLGFPAPKNRPGNALSLIQRLTANGTSQFLDFRGVITDQFDTYVLEMSGLGVDTNAVSIGFRVSADGGLTYLSGTEYFHSRIANTSAASAVVGAAVAGDSSIVLAVSVSNTAPTAMVHGTLRLHCLPRLRPSLTFAMTFTDSTAINNHTGGGQVVSNGIDSLRLFASSGLFASGYATLYGMKTTSAP